MFICFQTRASILFQNTASTDLLPLTNTPEVFGLHPNAEINYYSQTTREIWSHLIELQPQTGKLCVCMCVFMYILYILPLGNRQGTDFMLQ